MLPEALISALIAGIVAIVVAGITAATAVASARKQFKLEDASEKVAHALLNDSKWRWRTFRIIKHHLSGFEENELRKILVRAGAIRVDSPAGEELWGLLSRNSEYVGVERINAVPYRPESVGEIQQQQG